MDLGFFGGRGCGEIKLTGDLPISIFFCNYTVFIAIHNFIFDTVQFYTIQFYT